MQNPTNILDTHPCFSRKAHNKYGRIHLPIAPVCNIKCRFCVRDYDCVNESRPGVSSRILGVGEAVERVGYSINREERIRVVGIAGPGDPLANSSTFEVLSHLHREFPELILCLSTNGLLLQENLKNLMDAGVSSLTVTINATTPETAQNIYSWVSYRGRVYKGAEAASLLLCNQWRGISDAVETGFLVKLNFVLVPGVNSHEAVKAARIAGGMGVELMNIIPVIPQGDFADINKPSADEVNTIRNACCDFIPQMRHCRQCRADAFGLIGTDKNAEAETMLAQIGAEYLELVQ